MHSIDEAGFDVLQNTPESRTPSALYTEKAFVLSKNFIQIALVKPPAGFVEIIKWLYHSSEPGPKLLRTVVKECRAYCPDEPLVVPSLLPANLVTATRSMNPLLTPSTLNEERSAVASDQESERPARLSSGALVLLKRQLRWLEEWLFYNERSGDEQSGLTSSISVNMGSGHGG